MEKAYFAAGCFWGVEAEFRKVKGVTATAVGYQGGTTPDPSYEQVCTGSTGHAEVVEVTFDSARVGYEALLDLFWSVHDPTTLNRQGPDVGSQYRSAIFAVDKDQAATARISKEAADASGRFRAPIVTKISAAPPFYMAEDYHQQYFEKRTGILHRLM